MKKLLLPVAICFLGISAVQAENQPPHRQTVSTEQQLLKQFDGNGDGKLDALERRRMLEAKKKIAKELKEETPKPAERNDTSKSRFDEASVANKLRAKQESTRKQSKNSRNAGKRELADKQPGKKVRENSPPHREESADGSVENLASRAKDQTKPGRGERRKPNMKPSSFDRQEKPQPRSSKSKFDSAHNKTSNKLDRGQPSKNKMTSHGNKSSKSTK